MKNMNNWKENSFFSQIKSNFTEAVNWIMSQDEVDAFATVINKFVSDLKEKYQTEGKDTNQNFKVIHCVSVDLHTVLINLH